MFLRRIKQFVQVFFSDNFHRQERTKELYNERYAHEDEMEYYRKIALEGLDDAESERINKVLTQYVANKEKSLVVGCGTGREVFALMSTFKMNYGVDTCSPMIEYALKISRENLYNSNVVFEKIDSMSSFQERNFNFIYLTITLMNHIKGRENRINFYKSLKEKLAAGGVICGFSNVFPMSKTHHFYWVSQILRIKAWLSGESWEPGDSVRSYLGSHTSLNFPIFYHFDQSSNHILEELKEAGLQGEFVFSNFWIAKPNNIS